MPNYLTLPIEIEQVETGYYLATSPVLPGFLMESTIEDIYRYAGENARILLEVYKEMGKPIPELEPIGDHIKSSVFIPISSQEKTC